MYLKKIHRECSLTHEQGNRGSGLNNPGDGSVKKPEKVQIVRAQQDHGSEHV